MKNIMIKSTFYVAAFVGVITLSHELSAMENAFYKAAEKAAANVDWNAAAERLQRVDWQAAAEKAADVVATVAGKAQEKVQEYAEEKEDEIKLTADQKLEACDRIMRNAYSTEDEKAAAQREREAIIRERDAKIDELKTDTVKTAFAAGKAELDKRAAEREKKEADREVEPAKEERPAEKPKGAFGLDLPRPLAVLQEIPWSDIPWSDLVAGIGNSFGKAAAGTLDAANKVADMAGEKIHEANKTQKDRIQKESLAQMGECYKIINNSDTTAEEKQAAEQRVTQILAKRDEDLALLERDISAIRSSVMATAVKLRNQLLVLDSIVEVANEKLNKPEAKPQQQSQNPLLNDNNE
jgi:hypothetical protein